MEIEAKFAIHDSLTTIRLGEITKLGNYSLTEGRRVILSDTYMDTDDRALFQSGYSCRLRKKNEDLFITVKSLTSPDGVIHRRVEHEFPISVGDDPTNLSLWMRKKPRDLVSKIIGTAQLRTLFVLHQVRLLRFLRKNDMSIAEMDIDHVIVRTDLYEQEYYELEIELLKNGTEEDLNTVSEELMNTWHLEPENSSKYQRGLQFVENSTHFDSLLAPDERRFLKTLSSRDDLYGRRAAAILALDAGKSQIEAGKLSGMSERRVRHWLSGFRTKRLAIFPKRLQSQNTVIRQSQKTNIKKHTARVQNQSPSTATGEPSISMKLLDQYRQDLLYRNATRIFEILSPVHGLVSQQLRTLEICALILALHQRGGSVTFAKKNHGSILPERISGLDEESHIIISMMLNLSKRKITSKRMERIDAVYLSRLPELRQREALILASILRMAEGIASSEISPDDIKTYKKESEHIVISITGPVSTKESKTAESRADLWRLVTGVPVTFESANDIVATNGEIRIHEKDTSTPEPKKNSGDSPGIKSADTMAEAARKTLLFHFNRMLLHEPGTREGSDIEELHDMRVATRRMRAAIQTFETEIDSDFIAPYLKDLKRTGRALGSVRDLDVFWERAEKYRSDLPANRRNELDALKDLWFSEREAAREIMLTYLDSRRYARFKDSFAELVGKENSLSRPIDTEIGATLPRLVSHAVPVILYERLAAVLAYDGWITKPDASLELFHELRISAKKLRYALEFCREVLAPECKDLIKEMKRVQDHLGDMQDAVVASSVLRNYLVWGTWDTPFRKKAIAETPRSPVVAPGAAMYLAHMQNLLKQRMESFPEVWRNIQSPAFTRRFAGSLVTLRHEK